MIFQPSSVARFIGPWGRRSVWRSGPTTTASRRSGDRPPRLGVCVPVGLRRERVRYPRGTDELPNTLSVSVRCPRARARTPGGGRPQRGRDQRPLRRARGASRARGAGARRTGPCPGGHGARLLGPARRTGRVRPTKDEFALDAQRRPARAAGLNTMCLRQAGRKAGVGGGSGSAGASAPQAVARHVRQTAASAAETSCRPSATGTGHAARRASRARSRKVTPGKPQRAFRRHGAGVGAHAETRPAAPPQRELAARHRQLDGGSLEAFLRAELYSPTSPKRRGIELRR